MSGLIKLDKEYKDWLIEVSNRFRRSQIKASIKVNSEMLRFYWELGKDIDILKTKYSWGSNFYNSISKDLISCLPNIKSFSPRNLLYMHQFYRLYRNLIITPQVGAQLSKDKFMPQVGDGELQRETIRPQIGDFENEFIFCIPWGHTKLIIDRCKNSVEKALFYTKKTIENNWSRAVLLNFLDTDLYERQGKAITNFSDTLPTIQGELAQQLTKDPYNFDFLTLSERYNEKELKDALMDNITKFLLELGNGFAFVGREVRLEVGETEKFIDMLFYNIKLHCYVVLEVKVSEFDSSYAGQLSTYVVAVNHQLKEPEDKPTIGLLVCKSLDKVEAQYALEATSQPIGVSGYELYKLIPENFKGTLPSIEEIETELGKLKSES